LWAASLAITKSDTTGSARSSSTLADGRLRASPEGFGARQIVEHVTVSDPDARYPIATGELLVLRNNGGDVRYHWTCEIPHGDDYLAAEIVSLTLTD